MNAEIARKLKLTLKPCQKKLIDAQANPLTVCGRCKIAFTLNRRVYIETFIIVEKLDGAALIGWTFGRQFSSIRFVVNGKKVDFSKLKEGKIMAVRTR
uniref:Uncharacterized protein n=1 Tax=Panagrolaimus sp. ES5 TaxID=591445 RepID=A0AC34FC85_9BILA